MDMNNLFKLLSEFGVYVVHTNITISSSPLIQMNLTIDIVNPQMTEDKLKTYLALREL